MWFDVQAALAEIRGGKDSDSEPSPCATRATTATQPPETPSRVAHVAHVARRTPPESESAMPPSARPKGGLHPDAAALAEMLRHDGPMSYGAAATRLGWGVTRGWQAEARLRAAGLVRLDGLGRACLAALGGPSNGATQ